MAHHPYKNEAQLPRCKDELFAIDWRFCPNCGNKLYQKTEQCAGSISIKCQKCGLVSTVNLAFRKR